MDRRWDALAGAFVGWVATESGLILTNVRELRGKTPHPTFRTPEQCPSTRDPVPRRYTRPILPDTTLFATPAAGLQDASLIATIAAGLAMAFVFALVAAKFRLPLILGYLAAGMAIGPFTPGFVADEHIAHQLSEIGVSLLMFGVGLHFSIKDLLSVKKIAIPGAIAQIIVATILGIGLANFWGWKLGAGLVFGICLSVASTVVLLRALNERQKTESAEGKIAVGWLIVEDLVTVFALVMLPALSSALGGKAPEGGETGSVGWVLFTTIAKVGFFVVAMMIVGKKLIPLVLGKVARTGSRELFTLGTVGIALGIAFGAAALFGISPALGAFFAGIVISESDLSHQASAEMLPLQETFTVLFFVSVGMMFDPRVMVDYPLHVLGALAVVMVGKSLAAAAIVLLFRYPVSTALIIAASLAQIGEFSFILVNLGISLELVPREALSIVLAVAILSIALNSVIFRTIDPIDHYLRRHPRLLSVFERPVAHCDYMTDEEIGQVRDHVIMVGYGRVGSTIGRVLESHRIPYIVIDQDRVVIESLSERKIPTVFGDAARPGILSAAGLRRARLLIVATPSKSQAREIVEYAHKRNPDMKFCVRTHDWDDAVYYAELGVENVVIGELELALQMSNVALETFHLPEDEREQVIDELRHLGSDVLKRPV